MNQGKMKKVFFAQDEQFFLEKSKGAIDLYSSTTNSRAFRSIILRWQAVIALLNLF